MKTSSLSMATMRILRKLQRNEVTEEFIYRRLASRAKYDENRELFLQIAEQEKKHADILKKYTERDVQPRRMQVMFYMAITRMLGLAFGVKLMERGEGSAQKMYAKVQSSVPEAADIAREEDEHENDLLSAVREDSLEYAGSIVLGLNDALVELTGALAGLTFALRDSKLTAAAGLITGIAASMSMAASEYLRNTADHDDRGRAIKSSVYTGIAYIITVILLIFPYLVIPNGTLALAVTLVIAVIIIFTFNFYLAVARGTNFHSKFWEMAILSFSVAGISFGVGLVVRSVFGIDV